MHNWPVWSIAAKLLPLLIFALAINARAQVATTGATNTPLVVAVRAVPPFAMKDASGNWQGLSVDLWEDVARRVGLRYAWKEMPLQETLNQLTSGQVDVAVTALTITTDREQKFDFTHPYYVSGLALGYPGGGKRAWLATLRGFFSIEFLSTILSLTLVLLAAGFAVWLFEGKENQEQFRPGLRGLADGFWWSAVTMTTVGYGDKAPKTTGGRLVALIWMFTSLVIIASFTASIAASLTAHQLSGDLLANRDLSDLKVAVLTGSSANDFATAQGATVKPFDTLDAALAAVQAGEAEAILHDAPILRYRARTGADWLEISQRVLVRDDYGYGLTSASPLREEVNAALLSILHEPSWEQIRRRYLGEGDG